MPGLRTYPFRMMLPLLLVAGCGEHEAEPLGPETTLEPTATAPAAALASNTWVRFADLPTPRRGAAMAAVPKVNGASRLFAIAGGLRKTKIIGDGSTFVYSVPVGTVTEYLPNMNRWA